MKRYLMILAMLVFSSGFAQVKDQENRNTTEQTTTTKATVKTKKGDKTIKRETKIKTNKNLELQNADKKRVNYQVKDKPYKVEMETSYSMDNESYNFTPDDKGFTVSKKNGNSEKMMPYAKARRTTQDGYYIMTTNNNRETSFGTFDSEGNFRMERYDPKRDEVVTETYRRNK